MQSMSAPQSVWYLYMIRTNKNYLYTGITTDIVRRFKQHQSGQGAKALRGKGELHLVYQVQVGQHSTALKLEYWIKQQTKAKKERLVIHQPSLIMLLKQQVD